MTLRRNEDKDWKAYFQARYDEAESKRTASAAPSKLKTLAMTMTASARAFEEGAVPMSGPSKGPRPFFAKLVYKPSRFEEGYPEAFKDTDPDVAASMSSRRRRKIDSRVYGSWSDLPPELRYHFTEKERASLHVVASIVLRHGFCDKSVKEIADLAGVGVSTVKTALKEAKALGLVRIQSRPRKGRNHLPSIITIISVKWRNWLKSLVAKKSATIKNSRDIHRTKRDAGPSQGAFEGEKAAPQSMTDAASYAELNRPIWATSCMPGVVSNFRP